MKLSSISWDARFIHSIVRHGPHAFGEERDSLDRWILRQGAYLIRIHVGRVPMHSASPISCKPAAQLAFGDYCEFDSDRSSLPPCAGSLEVRYRLGIVGRSLLWLVTSSSRR
jgi:hypothetical protein